MLGNNSSHFPETVKHKSEINISEVCVYAERDKAFKKLNNNGEAISLTASLKLSLYHERIETLFSTDAPPELDSSSHSLSSQGRGHTHPSCCDIWDRAAATALHFQKLYVHNVMCDLNFQTCLIFKAGSNHLFIYTRYFVNCLSHLVGKKTPTNKNITVGRGFSLQITYSMSKAW